MQATSTKHAPAGASALSTAPAPSWEGEADLPARLVSPVFSHAATHPQRMAIGDGARVWSYAELAHAVRSGEAFLRSQGVQRGDRVMLIGENGLVLAALILACGAVNAIAVLENARRAPLEVDAIKAHAQPRVIVFTTDVSPDAAQHAERAGATEVSLPMIGALSYARATPGHPPQEVEGTSDDVGFLIYTTGTTGTPKGVMLTHRNLLYLGAMMLPLRGFNASDRVYCVLPITHVMGLAVVFGATMRAGGFLRLAARFSVQDCVQSLARDGITVLQGAPAMFAKLVDHARTHAVTAPALRYIGAGGAPIDAAIKADTESLFKLPLHNGYGLTEASALCWTRLQAPRQDCSVGLPLPGVELRVLTPDLLEAPQGQAGDLWVRGPNVMKGYYRDPALTAKVTRPGGWFNTQDLARIDLDGAVQIQGRTKDLIIASGFNVYPLEVENALNSHPAIVHSAVLGREVDGNEQVIAFVELASGASLSLAELQAHLSERLSPYKRPRAVYAMDAIPSSPNGKVLKHKLKDLVATPDPALARPLA
ncbi:class I adenylate-forming enzyme family protein [Pseudorhodoferax soli]|uniref:Acyl-CoA synthetase (AMP-forming)/AMP-acid ligase II n=1 Tax=Pseudorhodoferax soli TaxID=545864 RepID=A0A368XN82_9BURK|nr:AMP-binding protein [Pseudorhodoferax soli]RCW68636.1 acyl-CoA synthetase (AMP-forming)/AMP-acid ligase II [Pseudorhodoferax soli]